jgi:asparagine synthase (glutamine-hydrolysing)
MKVHLSKLQWYNDDNIWVTGFIREGERYLRENDLIAYFANIDTVEQFEQRLFYSNGHFSVIIKHQEELWAATDRLRNYPLFYSRINGEFALSDDCYKLLDEIPEKRLDQQAVDSFMCAGYVVNNLTLLKGIFQVEAGEFIREGRVSSRKFYYDLTSVPVLKRKFDIAAEELSRLFSLVFESHFKALKDKFIVIPLSGGFDSRLVASMCSRYHPENVLCYTYGTRNNPEVAPAMEVARRLGFKWINIVYDSGLIDGYLNNPCFNEYYQSISGLSSMFFMQEYFAVKYLKEKMLIPENSVFIPGFCGDVLAGCNLIPSMKRQASREHISNVIYNEFFRLCKLDKLRREEIIKLISQKLPSDPKEFWKVFECWDHKEPKAKFNVNSAKVFSFFGYDFVLPLWDSQLEDFFSALPFEYKLNKKLYDYVLTHFIFKEHNLNLSKELNPKSIQKSLQRVKERLKKFVPAKVRDKFINYYSPVLYDEITGIMINDMPAGELKQPLQPNYYNSYITQWYIAKTKELLRNP